MSRPDSSPRLKRHGDGWVIVSPRLAKAAKGLDLSTRGTRQELDERDREELLEWAPYRRRANALLDG